MTELELVIDGLAFGGEAVGRDATGRVVFVAGGAPGDRVRVRIIEEKRKFARGELVEVLDAGARVTPPCPLAGECGGCPWQHVTPEAQLAAKQEIVTRALARVAVNVRPIVAAPAWLGYRGRARMTSRAGKLGFQARRSRRVVDVETCPALEPALDRALAHARVQAGAALGDGGSLEGRVEAEGVRVALLPGDGADQAALLRARKALADEGLLVQLGRPVGFAQANRAQNERLRELVRDAVRAAPGPRVLELHAGDGNFTEVLVADGRDVVAVEVDRAAVARLKERAKGTRVLALPARAALGRLKGERFDVVLLDPPRTGAPEAMAGLAALAAPRIVYVSCDPMTLARDLGALVAHGYRVEWVQPIDMMPHTSHVEVVAVCVRA